MKLALCYNVKLDGDSEKDLGAQGVREDCLAEWDDMETITAVRDSLLTRHDTVELVIADSSAYGRFRELKPDMVFNMAEGLRGESREAHIPAILEMLGIPYTGSGPLALGLCLNKARSKQVLTYYNVPNPAFTVIDDVRSIPRRVDDYKFPLMVKPLYEGSSKGIRNDSLVSTPAELKDKAAYIIREYSQPALVEEFLSGREFTVAMLGNGKNLRVLPIVEINFSSLPEGVKHIYSYEAKWILDRPDAPLDIFECPASLDEALKDDIVNVARDAFQVMELRDWCRIDVRLDSLGKANIIELNPLPGILPSVEENSCFPKAARAAGMDFTELVNTVVECAIERYGL
jgi:D-alanine-D-alanine ligase